MGHGAEQHELGPGRGSQEHLIVQLVARSAADQGQVILCDDDDDDDDDDVDRSFYVMMMMMWTGHSM